MTRLTIRMVASAVLTLATGCTADSTTAPRLTPHSSVRTARTPAIPTIPLVVTISPTDDAGVPYGIRDDGQGVYTDGLQGVKAVLDQNGTFAFNTQPLTGKKIAVRWVTYSFNNPVDPANTYRPNPSNSENYHFSTGGADGSPILPIQNLGVNGNPSVECIYMGNSFANSSTSWRVSFHKGLEDTSGSPTAYAVVTRVSVSPAVWTIAPSGSCSPVSNVASLRSGDGSILYGYYNIPFLLTLRPK